MDAEFYQRQRSGEEEDVPIGFPVCHRIGTYRLLEELGRGSMGVVYRARDEQSQATLAVKLLLPGVAADPVARRRLLEEARKTMLLADCPHVVGVLEAGVIEGHAFIAMELVECPKVSDWLASRKGVGAESPGEQLVEQLAEGLARAHEVGLVHRDVKPANLAFDPRTETLKILDFGIAKELASLDRSETFEGIAGTPLYMAPELLQMLLGFVPFDRRVAASPRIDVYSFAVTAVELLTGATLFADRGTYAGLLRDKRFARLPPATSKHRWAKVLRSSLSRDPGRRPGSAREVLMLIRAVPSRRRWSRAPVVAGLVGGVGGAVIAPYSWAASLIVAVAAGLVAWWCWRRQFGHADPTLDHDRAADRTSLAADTRETLALADAHIAVDLHEEYRAARGRIRIVIGRIETLRVDGWMIANDPELSNRGRIARAVRERTGDVRQEVASVLPAVHGSVVRTSGGPMARHVFPCHHGSGRATGIGAASSRDHGAMLDRHPEFHSPSFFAGREELGLWTAVSRKP